MRIINCKMYNYKAKLAIGNDGEYKGFVYVMRDLGQGRSWKNIVAYPQCESRSIFEFCTSIEDAVRYVAND